MMKTRSRDNAIHFNIKATNNILPLIAIAYIILVLYIPNFIKDRTIVYSISAASYIASDPWNQKGPWLLYSISWICIPALIMGIFLRPKKDQINLKPILLFVLVRNIVRFFVGETSIFTYGDFGDYSIFFSLLIGYGCYLLLSNKRVLIDLEDCMDLIIILNFITQILFVITGRRSDYGGRYAALGSSVGELGVTCFTYIIYYLYIRRKEKNNYFAFFSALVTLVISGSRTNFVLTLICALLFLPKLNRNRKNVIKVAAIVGAVFALMVLFGSFDSTIFGQTIGRITDFLSSLFSSSGNKFLEGDSSFSGRIASIQSGFITLSQNPFGISASTIDLQIRTQFNGYNTFPHSTLLSYYLLWGIPVLFVLGWMIFHIYKSFKNKNSLWIFLVILLIFFSIYGAPIINSKTYFWYLLLFGSMKVQAISGALKKTIVDYENKESNC